MADKYEVLESSVVKLADDEEAIRFDAGEVTPKSKAEEAALVYLTKTDPPMARKLGQSGGDS